jgi:putative addiction module component (TIGR02574 family)
LAAAFRQAFVDPLFFLIGGKMRYPISGDAMSDIVLDLAQRGQSLPPSECERLVELLLKSLVKTISPDITQAWDREIALRVAAYQRGEVATYALEEVLAQAQRIAP